LSNSDDGVITVDGVDFGKAFSEAAGDADRAFSELMDPSERIIGYLSALRWFAFTGDDEGQIFARVWMDGAQYGYPSSRRHLEERIESGEYGIAQSELPYLAAVYALNWGDLYAGASVHVGELRALRDQTLVPEFYRAVDEWLEQPQGTMAAYASTSPLGTADAALAKFGPNWRY
jgi:hypothetical protein